MQKPGFTLIEVLAALAIAVMLVGGVSSALILSLRAERAAQAWSEESLKVGTLYAQSVLKPEKTEKAKKQE